MGYRINVVNHIKYKHNIYLVSLVMDSEIEYLIDLMQTKPKY